MQLLSVVAGIIVLAVVVVGGAEVAYRMNAYYAPRYEDVRRETYEHSRAFQEGTIRDLDNLRLDWTRQPPGPARDAVADVARHRLADVPIDQLPPELQDFATQVGAR